VSELPPEIAALVSETVRGAVAYHVPAPPLVRAKLDANELPVGLTAELRDGLAAHLASVALERYPDAGAREVRTRLARRLGVTGDQIVLGNGSDELIALIVNAFAAPRPGAPAAAVIYPSPTFVYYKIAATARGVRAIEVPLRADFTLDEAAFDAAVAEHRPNVALFALPNNPTGTMWPMSWVLDLAARHPDLIVVSDEAYVAYSGQTAIERLRSLPNLIVMRTLSKVGLAGLRVGFIAASPAICNVIERIRPPYNMGTLNQHAAAWILDHAASWLDEQARLVVAERPRLAAALAALPGVTVFDSAANLVLIRVAGALAAWRRLQDRGVLVRCFDRGPDDRGPLAGCLRITVGTRAENDLVVAELAAALA
jgi:histidinol-phosphate aminotransferase